MRIIILGAAGFIGTNLAIELAKEQTNNFILVDQKECYFDHQPRISNAEICIMDYLSEENSFDKIINEGDIVYHLISTNDPTSSNKSISKDLTDNITISLKLLETCVKKKINKIVFISSGGTVYGPNADFPIIETEETNPINTYGIQKLTIEKLLFLYHHMYDLNYKIIRLANPYGPYQRPNGKLGVISTFLYKALHDETLFVYGDGTVVRDYIYIDDAINGIIKITGDETDNRIYNLGSGKGTSVNEIIGLIEKLLKKKISVQYMESRSVDVPMNVLCVDKYVRIFGDSPSKIELEEGIELTKKYFESRI